MARKRKVSTYTMPSAAVLNEDKAANLAHFLAANAGSVCGFWRGPMKAADQRALFGRFLGRGKIGIDGAREQVTHTVSVCFGCDFDTRERLAWGTL